MTLLVLALAAVSAASEATPRTLYAATLVQAAPGRLLELIETEKALSAALSESGDEPRTMVRHSQGDKWDLLLLSPMGNWESYFAPDRVARRERALEKSQARRRRRDLVAWQEDVFVWGPPASVVRDRFSGARFFHVEMFVALAGRHEDLYREREMENAYLKTLARPLNLIFVRDRGAAWDLFTIGCYRDLKHYAESADIPEAAQDAAAKAAGFDGAKAIGPTLRACIREHHDTLATAVP